MLTSANEHKRQKVDPLSALYHDSTAPIRCWDYSVKTSNNMVALKEKSGVLANTYKRLIEKNKRNFCTPVSAHYSLTISIPNTRLIYWFEYKRNPPPPLHAWTLVAANQSDERLTYFGSVNSSSISSGDATAQQANLIQRGPRVHFSQGDLSHHGVLWERTAAHEVEEALAFAGETACPIWHQAFALSEPEEHDMDQIVQRCRTGQDRFVS